MLLKLPREAAHAVRRQKTYYGALVAIYILYVGDDAKTIESVMLYAARLKTLLCRDATGVEIQNAFVMKPLSSQSAVIC